MKSKICVGLALVLSLGMMQSAGGVSIGDNPNTGVIHFQTAPKAAEVKPPTLDKEQSLTLEVKLQTLRNVELQIQTLQMDLQTKKTELDELAKALNKPGFVLNRNADGTWVYVAAPAEVKK